MKCIFIIWFVTGSWFFFAAAAEEEKLDPDQVEIMENEDFLEKVKELRPEKFTDLAVLSPFSDVSVIQRRFMPKTHRFSTSLASSFVLSSEYFLHSGVEGCLAFHFLEKHGVELSGSYVFDFERHVVKDLKLVDVNVSNDVYRLKKFAGFSYKWMPVYGKMALFNDKILSFDTFFSIGGGMSHVTKGSKSKGTSLIVWEPTVMTGVGQVFAFNRDFGFRWDLKGHFTIKTKDKYSFSNHFLLSLGLIQYFPSAGLR